MVGAGSRGTNHRRSPRSKNAAQENDGRRPFAAMAGLAFEGIPGTPRLSAPVPPNASDLRSCRANIVNDAGSQPTESRTRGRRPVLPDDPPEAKMSRRKRPASQTGFEPQVRKRVPPAGRTVAQDQALESQSVRCARDARIFVGRIANPSHFGCGRRPR